jgi:uncharacterized Zn finger protein
MGRKNDDWEGWPRYVPVAERQEKARKQAAKLTKKKGEPLSPIVVSGRTIAATFWGKAWCQNLEQYSDYSNRIPRGRTYVRNGSVIDLKIAAGQVIAQVSGTHLYSVKIEIRPLKPDIWLKIKNACMGKIGSLIELLQGKLSREVMEIVTRPHTGLFPEPAEISFQCSCPDWAYMCKHIAATLYGIGARLDLEPELLFLLRGVDHRELIAAPAATAKLSTTLDMEERGIAEEDISDIFGIEIDREEKKLQSPPPKQKRSQSKEMQTAAPQAAKPPASRKPLPEKAAPKRVRKEAPSTGTSPQPTPRSVPKTAKPKPVSKSPAEAATTKPVSKSPAEAATTKPARGPVRKIAPATIAETPEPVKPRRGRRPKAADSTATPPSAKQKPGRPGEAPKV